jgi:hypothetical protein
MKWWRALAYAAIPTAAASARQSPLPDKVNIVVADQIYIDHTRLLSAMTARLIRSAAFLHPEFYRAQSMRCEILHARIADTDWRPFMRAEYDDAGSRS